MTRQDTAHLAFKITGLYCLIEAIPYIGWALNPLNYTTVNQPAFDLSKIAVAAISPGLLIGLGSYLLVRARKIAESMFPDEASTDSQRVLGFHALAFSVLAVFVTIDALPSVLSGIVVLAGNYQQFASTGFVFRVVCEGIVVPLIKLALGLALFFGSHGLVRFWSRLRYAGIRDKLGLCTKCGYDLSGNTSGVCPECGTAKSNSKPDPR